MKKIKTFFLTLSAPLTLSVLAASCTQSSDDTSNKNKNVLLINKLKEYQTKLKKLKINYSYDSVENKVIFEQYDNSNNSNVLALLKNILLSVLDSEKIYGQKILGSGIDSTKDFDLLQKYEELLTDSRSQTLNQNEFFKADGTFHNYLKSINSFVLDLLSQLANDSLQFKNFTESSNTSFGSRMLGMLKDIEESGKVVENSKWQANIKSDYAKVANLMANLANSQWNEETDSNFVVYDLHDEDDDHQENDNHAHSHALGNMSFEMAKIIRTLNKDEYNNLYKENKNSLLQAINDAITKESDQGQQKALREFKNKINLVFSKYETLIAFNYNLLNTFAQSLRKEIESVKTILTDVANLVPLSNEIIATLFPNPRLANNSEA